MTRDDERPSYAEISGMFSQFFKDCELVDEKRLRDVQAKARQRDREWLAEQEAKQSELPEPSFWDLMFAASSSSESPIENEMLRAIILRGATRAPAGEAHIAEIGPARLYAQLVVGSYRVDIALVDGDARLVVECDGRAYHSTEAQLLADRRRDRELTHMGWRVIRYSGSETSFFTSAGRS